MALLLFVLLISLFILGVPIAFSLGLASAITVWHGDLMPMLIVAQQMLAVWSAGLMPGVLNVEQTQVFV